MINMSLFEKIKCFFQIVVNNNSSLLIISILAFLAFLILFTCKLNRKLIKILYIMFYIGAILLIGVIYYEQILTLIDYLIENIVANLLFPNLAIYVAVLLVINSIVLITIFSNKIKFYVKSINIVCFVISQLFLYLIIDNVIVNNINVYEKLSIYTNQELLVLIELSMQLFVVWILVLLVIRFVDYLMSRSINEKSKISNNLVLETETDFEEEYNQINTDINKKDVYVSAIDYSEAYNNIGELIEYVPIKKVKKSF